MAAGIPCHPQHSDTVWVIARIHTSTHSENNRTEALAEAKRVVDSIEPISLDLWSKLVADALNGYSVAKHLGVRVDRDESP